MRCPGASRRARPGGRTSAWVAEPAWARPAPHAEPNSRPSLASATSAAPQWTVGLPGGCLPPARHAPLVAHGHLGLDNLYRRTAEREQAQNRLTTATTMSCGMGMTYWLQQAEQEVKELQ